MKKLLRHIILVSVLSTSVLSGIAGVFATNQVVSLSDSLVVKSSSATDLQSKDQGKPERNLFSSWFFQPFRSASPQVSTEKLLSNVKVFPNPTVESINLTFRLTKRSEVSIKVMDALGNEMMTLLHQTLEDGDQNHSFEVQSRLNAGLYFVRVAVGAETVIKRVSIL